MSGTLYIVATPIGNLEDITLRAISILKEVDIVLAEDTRVSKRLLDYLTTNYQLPATNLVSYHQHSSEEKKFEILRMLLEGKNLALLTDAGTPGISDPGNELIEFLLQKDPSIKIVPIPGVSAVTAALSISGFRTDKFVFLGFLPKKKRSKIFKWLKSGKITFAFFESPNRILKTLEVLENEFSSKGRSASGRGCETRVFVARELTKLHETLYRGTINEVKEKLSREKVRGELTVILEL